MRSHRYIDAALAPQRVGSRASRLCSFEGGMLDARSAEWARRRWRAADRDLQRLRSPMQREPAIDEDHLAQDVTRGVRDEKGNNRGDLIGVTRTTKRRHVATDLGRLDIRRKIHRRCRLTRATPLTLMPWRANSKTKPYRSSLAPAAQPRPTPPGRALPAKHASLKGSLFGENQGSRFRDH